MQQSKAAIFRARARKQLVANCAVLRELGEAFHSASLMADLGERLISDLDKRQGEGKGEKQNEGPRLADEASTNNAADLVTQGRFSPLSVDDLL